MEKPEARPDEVAEELLRVLDESGVKGADSFGIDLYLVSFIGVREIMLEPGRKWHA